MIRDLKDLPTHLQWGANALRRKIMLLENEVKEMENITVASHFTINITGHEVERYHGEKYHHVHKAKVTNEEGICQNKEFYIKGMIKDLLLFLKNDLAEKRQSYEDLFNIHGGKS